MDGLTGLTFQEVKRRLAELGLPAWEKHSGGASSLVVQGCDGAPELVVHYPPAGEACSWRYPDDPWLPALRVLDRLLSSGDWEPPLDPPLAAGVVARRLTYNPGRRAAFLVSVPGSARLLVLKTIRADEAGRALSSLRAVTASRLPEHVCLPTLVATSKASGALLVQHLPGAPVVRWTRQLLDEVAGILTRIHRVELPGLPAWTVSKDAEKLERLLRLVEEVDPAVAGVIHPTVTRLRERLSRARPEDTTIHRDFTRRHLLLLPAAHGARLAVLDWDSVATGPPEKDLATLAASLDGEGVELVRSYERMSGRELDRGLVNTLAQTQRLARACRRIVSGERSCHWAAEAVRHIEAQLDDDPFRAR